MKYVLGINQNTFFEFVEHGLIYPLTCHRSYRARSQGLRSGSETIIPLRRRLIKILLVCYYTTYVHFHSPTIYPSPRCNRIPILYLHPIPHPISKEHETLCSPNEYRVVSLLPLSSLGSGGSGLFRSGGGREITTGFEMTIMGLAREGGAGLLDWSGILVWLGMMCEI